MKNSDPTLILHGHTIELRTNGTGSIDPWSEQYAMDIDLSIMCTADMAKFMLIDGDNIYKFDSFNDSMELHNLIDSNAFDTWDSFVSGWLNPMIEKKRVRDLGSLEESKRSLDESKKRDNVWKSIPKDKKREVYEYLKTLSKEEREEWYKNKISELEK